MKNFKPPAMTGLKEVISYLQRFVPQVGRELENIRKSIPKKGPTMEEVLDAVRESAEIKDAFYRYVKDRETEENGTTS